MRGRSLAFRALAGLIAAALCGLLLADGSARPAGQTVGIGVIAAALGLFAAFGDGPGDRLIARVFGPAQPPGPDAAPDERTGPPPAG